MLSEVRTLEKVMLDIKRLSLENRLFVIKLTSETLLNRANLPEMVYYPKQTITNPLRFGEYRGSYFTDLEDFKIAEWQPTNEYLNSF
ncbi:hypothetical protein PN36_06275 [Candidatus Thiomargarita nelsonii]|uniref:Uncharacterized protein n=1 Tax=Candidatus Thiomargarita nelsonii TaxID=1003181 RepID=A0A0A6PAD7_9GAMM|nr:hypothetical protein PN36_06275 [Candidatus Thiomargarita nelsonii]